MKLASVVVVVSVALASPFAAADKPKPAAAAPTKGDALAVVDAWVKAQNDGDFAAYGALYDTSFVGIKRTNDGGSKTYTLDKWKADRKKMFKGAQKVAAEGASVVIKDGKATVELTQRYQAGGYADHGDKELVLKPGASGTLAIVREEMLYSAPGSKADPAMEFDATALGSPITVTVVQLAQDPSQVDNGCGTVTYTLGLVDANHRKLSTDIGSGVITLEDVKLEMKADPKADKLFKFGNWCAGGADYYEIVKNGDSLVVRYKGEDEGDPNDPDFVEPGWETRLTIKLPAKATIR
jgi:hypothetical protein